MALFAAAAFLGGCAALPLQRVSAGFKAAPGCTTAEMAITFDFEGAAPARCVIEGPRAVALLIGPEHAPPINASPWYAFRYRAAPGAPVAVTLRYLVARHRYTPKLASGGTIVELPAAVGADGRSARLELTPGTGIVSAQPIVSSASYADFARRLQSDHGARGLTLGRSLDGRAIEALRFGSPMASHLIVLLGRQHPPEVTGHYAMEAFVLELAAQIEADAALARRYQVLAVPLLNPDGVALGHWRANRGGVDLNRDWGTFHQPETRAVRDFLNKLPANIRPVAQIDFHSTSRNLFYVQGQEATEGQRKFVDDWLVGKEAIFSGYDFIILRTNADQGPGTSKNWFHRSYGIPAITYEVGDGTDRASAARSARRLARDYLVALDKMQASAPVSATQDEPTSTGAKFP